MTPLPLTPEQRAIVDAVSGPVRILAGAGTGKTTTISHRIANQVRTATFRPEQILAVTFTRNSATWLRDHLARQGVPGVAADTFHAAALRIVRRWWPEWRGTEFPRTVDRKIRLLGTTPPSVDRKALATDIEWLKRLRATPETAAKLAGSSGRSTSVPASDLGRHLAAYESRKQREGALDFEDMMSLCIALLDEHAPARAWFDGLFHAFTVDEFQDVDPLQFALLKAWVGRKEDVCIVGDPYQAIYGFKGSSSSYLDAFETWRSEQRTFPLTTNFRSTIEVLAPANTFARRMPGEHRALRSSRHGDAPAVRGFASADLEERDLVGRIRALQGRGVPLEEMAVLYRLNSQSARFEEALTRARIPHQVAEGDFLQRHHVRRALQAIGAAPSVAAGLERASAEAAAASDAVSPDAGEDELSRAQDLATLARLVERYAAAGFDDLTNLTLWLRDVQGQQTEGVRLMTYHRAKGLEFEAVFLPEVQQGLIPFSRSVKEGGMDEERRLFYVGLTRAKRWLSITWSTGADGQRRSSPSPFIADLAERKEIRLPERRRTGIGIADREGATLAAITSELFGRGFTRGGRFAEDGWSVAEDAPTFACPECGGALAVASKPKELYGRESILYALLCGACAEVFERSHLTSPDQRLLSHWGKTGESELPARTRTPRPTRERRSPDRAAPVPEIDPDAGERLLVLTDREFGIAFDRSGRFSESGWVLQGTSPVRCGDCGTEYVVARKPYIAHREGEPYLARYFALLCARCRKVAEPKELPDADRKALKRWSGSR